MRSKLHSVTPALKISQYAQLESFFDKVFFCEYCEILKNNFFYRTFLAASEGFKSVYIISDKNPVCP